MKLNVSAVLSLVLFTGCAHSIHEVHTSDFLPGVAVTSGKMVTAKSEQFVIMGITGDTDYVGDAYTKLMAACPNGAITGLTTQVSTSMNFFSWTNKVLMRGLCLTPHT